MPEISIAGRDCMVQAVVSYTAREDYIDTLKALRLTQIQQHGSEPLSPALELTNLSSLLAAAGQPTPLYIVETTSPAQIKSLATARGGNVFIGFAAGPDTPPHIAHLGLPTVEGYQSAQQMTPHDLLGQQFLEQGKVIVFIPE